VLKAHTRFEVMKVWGFTSPGNDGKPYGVRLLMTPDEIKALQAAGLIPEVTEIVGMQTVADQLLAGFEREVFTACGGLTQ